MTFTLLCTQLARFENAVRDHEIKGSMDPEDWAAVEREYEEAKRALRESFTKLSEHITQGAMDMTRPISTIAREIWQDWSKIGKGINFAAKPYLDAMLSLDKITDTYGADSGDMIVAYFLDNATSYRGERARRLKAELNALLEQSNG